VTDRKWITRNYREGDEQGIVDLWKLVFAEGEQERGELAYWYWQFRDNPAGPPKIRLAIDGDKVVGQYAVIPMNLQFMGKSVLATLSLDTMTHPHYRRQGMFGTLANELYADLGLNGMPVTYGFPNDNSLGGFVKKLQWTHICSLPVYVKPLRLDVIAAQVISNPGLSIFAKPLARATGALAFRPGRLAEQYKPNISWLDIFDERADDLWDQVYDPAKIALVRNADYLNWRYFQNPSRDYRVISFTKDADLLGYVVLRCMEQFGLRGGMITDLIARPEREDVVQALLDAASEHFLAQGMDLIACLSHGDAGLVSLLKRNTFLLPPKQMAFKQWYFGGRVNSDDISQSLMDDPENWYLTFGDTDII
jgi:hypothetical protein